MEPSFYLLHCIILTVLRPKNILHHHSYSGSLLEPVNHRLSIQWNQIVFQLLCFSCVTPTINDSGILSQPQQVLLSCCIMLHSSLTSLTETRKDGSKKYLTFFRLNNGSGSHANQCNFFCLQFLARGCKIDGK